MGRQAPYGETEIEPVAPGTPSNPEGPRGGGPVLARSAQSDLPSSIRWLRIVIAASGLVSFVSSAHVMRVLGDAIEALSGVQESARAQAISAEGLDSMAIRQADVLTLALEVSESFQFVLSLLFLYLPIRYALLWRHIPSGHPSTHARIRGLATTQLLAELVRIATFVTTNEKTIELKVPAGWTSPGLWIPILLLTLLALRSTRAFFCRQADELGSTPSKAMRGQSADSS